MLMYVDVSKTCYNQVLKCSTDGHSWQMNVYKPMCPKKTGEDMTSFHH